MNKRGRLTVKYRSLKRYEVGVTLEEHNRNLRSCLRPGKKTRWKLPVGSSRVVQYSLKQQLEFFNRAHEDRTRFSYVYLLVIMRTSKTVNLLELRIGGLSKDNCATIVLLFVFKAF